MRLVLALITVTLLYSSAAEESTTNGDNDNVNSIETTPSVRLDPYIRKALLKALSELEESDTFSINTGNSDENPSTVTEILRTSDSLPTETPKEEIKIHSFVVNGQSAFSNKNNTKPTLLDKKISILSTTAGNVENYSTATFPTQATVNEIFQAKETGNNYQHVRSIQSTSKLNVDKNEYNKNEYNKNEYNTITSEQPNIIPKTTISTTTSTTTTTTTTTTTPKPTHNKDGENIEDVDKRDIQVFQAPLVAAFTVQQDELGLPKKVIPIYQQTNAQDAVKSQTLHAGVLPPEVLKQNLPSVNSNTNNNNIFPETDYINQQLSLQKQLEEKQRILEEQLRLLQIQQKQQEEILRKQQFILQQKELQRQQQIIFEQENFKRQQALAEQQRLLNNQAVNNYQLHNLQNYQQNQFSLIGQQNPLISVQSSQQIPLQTNSQVSIQPSTHVPLQSSAQISVQQSPQAPVQQNPQVSLQQSTPVSLQQGSQVSQQQNQQFSIQQSVPLEQSNIIVNQQLPNREAVDFLLHLRHQQSEQFPLQQNHLPQGIGGFLQPTSAQEDRSKHGNRVFRQETGVGNFGFNNQNYYRFNTFGPIYTNRNTFGNRPSQFNPDSELQQLLLQSGLSGRSQEDLNIVSKVLSLNHGIALNNNNIVSNRLPFDSRRHVKQFA